MVPWKRAVAVAAALFLLGIGMILFPQQHLLPSVRATTRTISLIGTLVGSYYYWNNTNPTITVVQGDTITIKASSANSISHQFLLDVDGDGLDTSDCSPPSTTGDPCSTISTASPPITFTVSFTPKTYAYYCTIHPGTMVGSFVVNAPPGTPDFSISSNPSSLTVLQGSSNTSTITITSVNSFSGTISFVGPVSRPGPSVSFNPTSVTLSSGQGGTSTMTVSAAGGPYSSVATGNYSVNVTATSGSLSRSTIVPVTVSSTTSPPPAGTPGLPVAVVVGAVIAIIAAIGVVVFLVRRKPVAT